VFNSNISCFVADSAGLLGMVDWIFHSLT